jgi:hypothetical protein
MIVPKDARALLHYRRCVRPRHLRVLRGERAGDADRVGAKLLQPRGARLRIIGRLISCPSLRFLKCVDLRSHANPGDHPSAGRPQSAEAPLLVNIFFAWLLVNVAVVLVVAAEAPDPPSF